MNEVYIVAAKRTAMGSFLGSLKNFSAAELGAAVVKQIVSDLGIDAANFDEVITGNILSAGIGQGVGRQVAIKGGIPNQVPAYSINMLCGSGMKAVMLACSSICAGLSNLVIAGGVESMSNAPMLLPSAVRQGVKMGEIKLVDHMIFDALTDAFSGVHMGITAENLATQHNISREQQDQFAIESQKKAILAQDQGKFNDEIVPITVVERKNTFVFDRDEFVNRTTSIEKLATLRPAFKTDGTVTAGNSSGINDAASYTVLASAQAVKKFNLKPLAKIVGMGQAGVEPQIMGIGPVEAIKKALDNCGKKLQEMDIIELNEAFAAQSLAVIDQLCSQHNVTKEFLLERTNTNGGAIALGHPVGASGNRILVTLLHEMKRTGKKLGLASLCIGGGMGTALVVEKV